MTYPDTKYYSGKQNKADMMVRAHGTYGGGGANKNKLGLQKENIKIQNTWKTQV